jgi:hypothetical protein
MTQIRRACSNMTDMPRNNATDDEYGAKLTDDEHGVK